MTRSYTASSDADVVSTPLISRNTAVANHPSRLFPSTRAWFFTMDCRRAAPFDHMGVGVVAAVSD